MTIAPVTLQELITSTKIEATREAIIARLKALLKGVSIASHPGKLDLNDVVEKAIVGAPGIALGWGRLRGVRDVAGTWQLPIEWLAYIVTEDFADQKANPPRRIGREVVALAIGSRLIQILQDDEAPFWGLVGLTDPWPDPAPEMRPLLTMKSAESGVAIYTVTWTQSLVLQGTSPFGGPAIGAAAMPDGMEFDLPDGEMTPELLALLGRAHVSDTEAP